MKDGTEISHYGVKGMKWGKRIFGKYGLGSKKSLSKSVGNTAKDIVSGMYGDHGRANDPYWLPDEKLYNLQKSRLGRAKRLHDEAVKEAKKINNDTSKTFHSINISDTMKEMVYRNSWLNKMEENSPGIGQRVKSVAKGIADMHINGNFAEDRISLGERVINKIKKSIKK